MMQATLSRSTMRSALVEAVCGLTEVLLDEFDLAAHHPAGGIDLLDRKIRRLHGELAERAEKAGARRQVTDPDDVGSGRAKSSARKFPTPAQDRQRSSTGYDA